MKIDPSGHSEDVYHEYMQKYWENWAKWQRLNEIRKLIEANLKKTFSNYKPGSFKYMFDGMSKKSYTSQFGADAINITRSGILDIPFFGYGYMLGEAFKIGKHATNAAKTVNGIIKGGTSIGVGLFGSSIVDEFVNVQKEVSGWRETFWVNAEFDYGQRPLEVVVHDNGSFECYYFNPGR